MIASPRQKTKVLLLRMQLKEKHTAFIKSTSQSLGFDYCGIANAQKLDEDAYRLETWLNKGFQGKMNYMENYFELRIDPTKLVPGAKSVITLLLNYFPVRTTKPRSAAGFEICLWKGLSRSDSGET